MRVSIPALGMAIWGALVGCGGVHYAIVLNAASSRVEEAKAVGAEQLAPYEDSYAKEQVEQAQIELRSPRARNREESPRVRRYRFESGEAMQLSRESTQRLVAKGYGFHQPLVPNTTAANRELNRRVQLIPTEATGDAAGGSPTPSPGAPPSR